MTKDQVISILKNENTYVSGEKMSQMLGVSRAAINTAVRTLRREGYQILSSTNRGYFLESSPDTLHTGDLLALLGEDRMHTVECQSCVDSTNHWLQEQALQGAVDGQVILAGEQTSGRGRRGRTFFSPAGSGLYLSILLRPEGYPADTTSITAWTAVAVSRALQKTAGITPDIKWVNDLYLNGKKICGILTEMSVESETGHIQYIIVGIGINVSEAPTDFPEELRTLAGSIFSETGKKIPRASLAAAVIRELDQMRTDWPQKKAAYLDAYRDSSLMNQCSVLIMDGVHTTPAVATGISDDFGLMVTCADGTTDVLHGGEVSIRVHP